MTSKIYNKFYTNPKECVGATEQNQMFYNVIGANTRCVIRRLKFGSMPVDKVESNQFGATELFSYLLLQKDFIIINTMDSRPCAVIASCTDTHPEDIIKSILGVEELPDYTEVEDGIKAYPWHIDTKYYTADVNLCAVEKKTLGSEDFAVSVEAIVVHFDSNRSDGLSAVEGWLSFLKEFEPEVQILLCDRCEEEPPEGLARVTVQEWCVEQGFELVELNPDLDPEWEAEQDFLETTGVQRVIQALHAHLWPNLRMKGKPQQLSRTVQSMLVGNAPTTPTNGNSDEDAHQGTALDNSSFFAATCTEERIDELLGDSGGVAGFSSLFEQLCTMKERVSQLPSDQRRACAEQVVMAFWKAIGGDDDELSGLGSN